MAKEKKPTLADLDPIFAEAIAKKEKEDEAAWKEFTDQVNRANITEAEKKAILKDAKESGYRESGNRVPRWGLSKDKPVEKSAVDQLKTAATAIDTTGIDTAGIENTLAALAGAKMASSLERRFPQAPVQVPPQMPQMPPQAMPPQAMPPTAPQAARPSPLPVTGGPAGPVSASPMVQQGGPGTFNYGKAFGLTDIEAGRALDMSKRPGGASDLVAQRAQALNRIQQMGGGFAENPRYGGLMTPDAGAGRGSRVAFTQTPSGMSQLPPTQPVPTNVPQPGALSRMASTAGQGAMRVMGSAPVSGALGGLGVMSSAKEYAARKEAGDPVGQALAGLGVAGGAAAMVPHPVPKYFGMGVSALSPLSLYLWDKMNGRIPQDIGPFESAPPMLAP